ncbi:MAG TPA: molybdopterin-dependent oxidoreductase, partial [Stellaceae bacterium]|nr:molybdopterin-dependent oxidoreductase [Stellaceae bacterium]
MVTEVRTTCPYCGVGCGVIVENGSVRGDPDHPANFGRLCSKGAALAETLDDTGRLIVPRIDGRAATWDEALDRVAARFAATIAEFGPDAVAFYGSGQFLTEDYYVANKLMKGFIGSANIDTNSRLCMASTVAGHQRAFGEDVVPGIYEDWDETDLAVLVGSNTAWCHPILYQRLKEARAARGTFVVVIDPRRTATCEIADLHLALAPGSDVVLFDGLLVYRADNDRLDRPWIDAHSSGFDAALAAARESAGTIAQVAAATGLPAADIGIFYERFAATERAMTVFSQGVNQSTAGTDKVNAII